MRTCFYCKSKSHICIFEHDSPASMYFTRTDFKDTAIISESISHFWDYFRQQSTGQVMSMVKGIARTVHECVSFCWMSMKIQKYQRIIFFSYRSYKSNLIILVRTMKVSVDVSPYNRSSEVAKYNPVNIHHRNNLKNHLLSKRMSLRWTNESEKAIHHPASLCFTRMQPPNSHTSDFTLNLAWICDTQDRNSQSLPLNSDDSWR